MPNGGGDCCARCVHNVVFELLGSQTQQKSDEERKIWRSKCECRLRGIKVPNPMHTYCANFSFFNKRESLWSDLAEFLGIRKRRFSRAPEDVKAIGFVYALGYPQDDVTYPRLPWDSDNEPVLGQYTGSCDRCGGRVGKGIRLQLEESDGLLFCSNIHYLEWWREMHPEA